MVEIVASWSRSMAVALRSGGETRGDPAEAGGLRPVVSPLEGGKEHLSGNCFNQGMAGSAVAVRSP
jgi:hypothetical protein